MAAGAAAGDEQDAVPGAQSAPAEPAGAVQVIASAQAHLPGVEPGSAPAATTVNTISTETAASAPASLPAALAPSAIVPAAAPAEAAAAAQGGSTGILGLHSDFTFSVLSAPRKPADATATVDAEALAFAEQVKRIAAGLQVAAQGLYAERVQRIGSFDVYVAATDDLGAMSSGTGKIAINAGLAKLKPTDDWLAFVIAREMGHVVAGHHDSNAGASLAVSIIMNIILPGSGLIKSAISFAGSQMASESGRDKQQIEADEAALKLLEAAGYTARAVALNLRLNPLDEAAGQSSRWAGGFRASALRLVANVQGPRAAQSIQVVQQPVAEPVAAVQAPIQETARQALVQSAAAPPAAVTPARWQPEEPVRGRPSGLPGPLLSGPFAMPVRRIE